MAEEFGGGDREFTFLGFDKKLMVNKSLKNSPNVGDMRGGIWREDDDIVEIDNTGDIEKAVKSGVDDTHEGGGGIGKAKWHDKTLVEAGSSYEGGFLSRGVIHWDLVEGGAKVESSKQARSTEKDERFGDQRKGRFVFDGNGIQLAVVNAPAVLAIGTRDGVKVCAVW